MFAPARTQCFDDDDVKGGVTQGTIGGRFVVLALAIALFSGRKDAIILYKTVKGDLCCSCTCHLTGKSNLKLSSPFNLEVSARTGKIISMFYRVVLRFEFA